MTKTMDRSGAEVGEKNRDTEVTSQGKILNGQNNMVSAQGRTELRRAQSIRPYGFFSIMPEGCGSVIIDGKIMGTVQSAEEFGGCEPGEVVIRSMGGAEIRLCNDGSITINGQRFERM